MEQTMPFALFPAVFTAPTSATSARCVVLLCSVGVVVGLLAAKWGPERQLRRQQPSNAPPRVAQAIPPPVVVGTSRVHPSLDADASVSVRDALIPFTVDTKPSGAKMSIEAIGDGKMLISGLGPLTLKLARGTPVRIRAELTGFEPFLTDDSVIGSPDVEDDTLTFTLTRRPTAATAPRPLRARSADGTAH
jgi:hypothetical protein